jgi:hypothetical protein
MAGPRRISAGASSNRVAQGQGRGNGRALDLGVLVCHLQADTPRVNGPEPGPRVAQVPWAGPLSTFALSRSPTFKLSTTGPLGFVSTPSHLLPPGGSG